MASSSTGPSEPNASGGSPESAKFGREQVAVVVAHLFEQRLSDTGRDATVLRAFEEQRIQHGAAVVDGYESHQSNRAGVRVDFDHRDVRAERERRATLVEPRAAPGSRNAAYLPEACRDSVDERDEQRRCRRMSDDDVEFVVRVACRQLWREMWWA